MMKTSAENLTKLRLAGLSILMGYVELFYKDEFNTDIRCPPQVMKRTDKYMDNNQPILKLLKLAYYVDDEEETKLRVNLDETKEEIIQNSDTTKEILNRFKQLKEYWDMNKEKQKTITNSSIKDYIKKHMSGTFYENKKNKVIHLCLKQRTENIRNEDDSDGEE